MVAVVDEMLLTYKTGQAMADRALNPAIGLLCQFLCFFVSNSAANIYVSKRRKTFIIFCGTKK